MYKRNEKGFLVRMNDDEMKSFTQNHERIAAEKHRQEQEILNLKDQVAELRQILMNKALGCENDHDEG